jgi:hypothetical protein
MQFFLFLTIYVTILNHSDADTNLDKLFLTLASSKRCDLRRAMLALLRGSWES